MTVASALLTLRRELVAIGVPSTRVEIWMAQPDVDRVLQELRGPAYRGGHCVRSTQQAAGFQLIGEPEVKDHAQRLMGDLIDA